ncbi:MAG: isochorismate synthase [Flammeovirgaceae bacterium]
MNTTFSSILVKATTAIRAILATAVEFEAAVAVWRLPFQTKIHVLVALEGFSQAVEPDLEMLGKGFVVAPFFNEQKAFFLRADWSDAWENEEVTLQEPPVANPSLEEFFHKVKTYLSNPPQKTPYHIAEKIPQITQKEDFKKIVTLAVEEMQAEKYQKVVLSRCQNTSLPTDFEVSVFFQKLCKTYQNAFISLISIPKIGTWLGASPETLVSTDANGIFRTVALAGTQPKPSDGNLKEVAWKQKEIEEQAMVSRYIINCFKKIRLREFEEIGPRTAAAGHLVHLKTDFIVDTQATGFPQLGTVMLSLLHPTSAVCGMPKNLAQAFILKHEGYERSLYSGYLGVVGIEKNIHLFVNLRCLQLHENEAFLYAGAGITADSNPEKEWNETVLKMQTMLKVIET